MKVSKIITLIFVLLIGTNLCYGDDGIDDFEIEQTDSDQDSKPDPYRTLPFLYGVYNTSDQTLSLSTSFVVTTIRIYANNQLVIHDTAPFFIDQTVSYPLASYPSGCYRVVVTLDGGSCLQSTFLR